MSAKEATSEFALRAKIDELDIVTHRIAQKLPKMERHVLGAELRQIMMTIVRLEIRAGQMQLAEARKKRPPFETLALLRLLDAEIGLFKRQIQKVANLGYLKSQGEKVQGTWSGLTIEVGKLLGSWLKTIELRVVQPPQKVRVEQNRLV